MTNRAYKFRIYPTDTQEILLSKTFGCCRFIYNVMLDEKIREYKETGKMKRTTPAMYKGKYPWLKEVDSLALANVQLHLESAYKKFFRESKVGFPKFKSKHGSRQSYTTNVVNGNISLEQNKIKLPKLGRVTIRVHREIPKEYVMKSVTVSRESTGKYFASILYQCAESENQTSAIKTEEAKVLGIDYAMKGMAVFSDGTKCTYPKYFRKAEEKLAKELENLGFANLPICMAKTQYSLTDDQTKLGAPTDFDITVRNLKISAGAGFIVALTGEIMTMPGLPKVPAAVRIDVDEKGVISGLF